MTPQMASSGPSPRVVKLRPPKHRFPDVWYEGLAYHEAGRTVAAIAVLEIPIKRVSLGYLSEDPAMNSLFELDSKGRRSLPASPIRVAAVLLTPQFAARLAPRYEELRTLHLRKRHLPPFEGGYRQPMRDARSAFAHIYEQAGLAESTARIWFRRDALKPIARFCETNLPIIRAVADFLYAEKQASGEQIAAVVARTGSIDASPLRLRSG
jgi:hypothetical protein